MQIARRDLLRIFAQVDLEVDRIAESDGGLKLAWLFEFRKE